LPIRADIGLCQLDAKSTRTVVAPTPKQRILEIQKMIPAVISQRNEDAKNWVKVQFRKLDKRVENVEEFVEQTNNYNHISENFQEYRDKVALYGEFYQILEDNELKVQKTDKDAHGESFSEIVKLQTVVQRVESSQEKDKERFKKDMNQRIPELDNNINDCFDRSKDPKYLDGDKLDQIDVMIQEMNAIEAEFKNLEETAERYNV
jgi:hypothetical protein